ncbi:MAG: hypothetical protein R2911_44130 [Caldilineaceae bacterium]
MAATVCSKKMLNDHLSACPAADQPLRQMPDAPDETEDQAGHQRAIALCKRGSA